MFTGIIEDLGKIEKVSQGELVVNTKLDQIAIGDSISVNGVCLTVTRIGSGKPDITTFAVDVSEETYKKTNLSELKQGDMVNLERSLPANGRFGGHFVTGHIECAGKIVAIKKQDNSKIFEFRYPTRFGKYLVDKGAVAVDGISLTIIFVDDKQNSFTVSIIPHTLANTILNFKTVGDTVNIETDILAKYVEKLLNTNKKSGITKEMLENAGF